MKSINLTVSDETLRDGEQQAGIFFDQEIKRNLAHLIAQTGVNQMAIMPAIHASEADLVKTLLKEGLTKQIAASTMMGKKFIDESKSCGVKQIILFHATSDRLLFLRDSVIRNQKLFQHKTIDDNIPIEVIEQTRQNMLTKVIEHLQYAQAVGLKVDFAAEDASRSDFKFLTECINKFQPYIDHFLLCDTVGILTPEKTHLWIREIIENTNQVPLSVHFHNDLGLALENTIQAVLAGVSRISGTFTGIGERAGNVALEQVLNGLRIRYGWQVETVNYDNLSKVQEYLENLGVRPNPPYSHQSQRQETGIHVNSLLADPLSYSIFPDHKPEIWFGKCSGASNFQFLFEKCLNQKLTREQYEKMRSQIKAMSIEQKRCFSSQDILAMIRDGVFDI